MSSTRVGIANAIPSSLNGRFVMDGMQPLPYDLRIRHRKDAFCSVVKQKSKKKLATDLDPRDCTMHNALMDIPGVTDVDVLRTVVYVRFDPQIQTGIEGRYFDYRLAEPVPTTYTDPNWWVRYDLDALGKQTAAELDELTTTSLSQATKLRDGWKTWTPRMLNSILGSGALLPPKLPSGKRRNSTRKDRGASGSGTRRKIRSARRSFMNQKV